jgi:hypothetical protein
VTTLTLFASLIIGGFSLAWGYGQVGLAQFVRWILIFEGLWLVAAWRRWRWFSYLGIAFNLTVAAIGLWFLNFAPGWMFAGAICGLVVWDLTYFQLRLRFAATDEERRHAELRHLQRISGLALLGFLLSSLAMAVKLQFSFEWSVLMVLVTSLCLMQIIRWFRLRT